MNKLYILPLILFTGCTTIGQQITNKDGIVQVHQQQTPIVTTNTKPVQKTKPVNNITKQPSQTETLVEVSETLISRRYIIN
jgi:hypothetical protein